MRTRRAGFLLLAAYAFVCAVAQPSRASGQTTPGGAYVGAETCIVCHEDQATRFKHTIMGQIFAQPRTAPEALGCESCHGPGKAHVDAGGGKETIPLRFAKDAPESAEQKNDACLTCHQKGNRKFWAGSPHQSRGIACVDCHLVMTSRPLSLAADTRYVAPLGDVKSLKNKQPDLCLECHPMRRAQLQRSSHMPFREGKVTCTSCHNPHGTANPKQLIQSTVNENCYSCHAERRGPFLWEHPPAVENCANCHLPHGSTNPQLLKTRTPKLCQECHNDGQHRSTAYASVMPSAGNGTPAGYNNRVVNRGCANCHSRIHGSNHPSGNYFTR